MLRTRMARALRAACVAGSLSATLWLLPGIASAAEITPAPPSASVGPMIYVRQTMDNCGPASIAEVLHYWHIDKTQAELKAILRKGNRYGMSTEGVPGYASSIGLRAVVADHGSERVVKALISNGFPVIVTQFVSMGDHRWHYREIDGYDDRSQAFSSTDTFLGANHHISYKEFDQIWTPTRRKFMVLYPANKEAALDGAIASAD